MNIVNEIPSVNYHLWKPCNMRCGFCFATFHDIAQEVLPRGHLGREDSTAVVEKLAEAGFRKINFAGGEPTLCPFLPDLIRRARDLGLTTSIVTNGSRVTEGWLESVHDCLDWAALSIDSVYPATLLQIGRTTRNGPMGEQDYLRVTDRFKRHDVRVKINTVVTRFNLDEDLTEFIVKARPERWKILQVLPVTGQNDSAVDEHVISTEEFEQYVVTGRRVEEHGIVVVPENNDLMTGSYVMVDPAGRFFDNVTGAHTYGRSIVDVGVEAALKDVSVNHEKFNSRGGVYGW